MVDNKGDFRISARTLEKEFLCNICFNEIEDCYITRCGHIYCKNCIMEAINRHHRCPFCNVELTDNDVFKNYHFNTLRKIVAQERQQAANAYLSKVFVQEALIEQELMAPIEKVIVGSMKEALLAYRKFLKDSFYDLQQSQEKKATDKANQSAVRTPSELIKVLHESILPHIKSPVIQPRMIPQKATLVYHQSAPNRNISLSLAVTSLTPVSQIVSTFQKHFKQANIRLESSLPNRQFIRVTIGERNYKLDDLLGDSVFDLANKTSQVLFHGIKPIRNIECYSYKWHNGKIVNYYTCKQCNINWICEVCKDYCHEGHEHVLQLKDHAPNWACCYCVTKCNCKALNKNIPV